MADPKVQQAFFDVSKGLADQVDPKLLPMGPLLTLTNCRYDKLGRIAKRAGHAALEAGGVYAPSYPWQIATHNGAPVVLQASSLTSRPLFSYLEDVNAWASAATIAADVSDAQDAYRSRAWANCMPHARDVAGDATDALTSDEVNIQSAAADGVLCTAWDEGAGAIRIVFQDRKSGKLLFDRTVAGTRCRVISSEDSSTAAWTIWLFYIASGDLKYERWTITGNTFSTSDYTATGTVGAIGADSLYDVHRTLADPSYLLIAYQDFAAPTTTVNVIRYRMTNAALGTSSSTTVTCNATMALAWLADAGGSGRALLATAGATDGIMTYVRNGTSLAAVSSWTIDAAITTYVRNITGLTISSDTGGEHKLVYSLDDAAARKTRRTVYYAQAVSGPTVTSALWLGGVELHSHVSRVPTVDGGYLWFVLTGHDNDANGAYYVHVLDHREGADYPLDSNAPAAVLFPREGGLHVKNCSIGMIDGLSPEEAANVEYRYKCHASLVRKTRIKTSGDTGDDYQFEVGTMALSLDFHPTKDCGRPVEAAGLLFIPGGVLRAFDGRNHFEYPFCLKPDPPGLSSTSTGSGVLTVGDSYRYRTVVKWVDRNGKTYRSAPSDEATVTIGGGHDAVTIVCPSLYTLGFDGTVLQTAQIEIYRSETRRSQMHLLATIDNDMAGLVANYTDEDVTDADLINGELLYTDGTVGAERANLAPPSALSVALWRDRIVVLRADRRREIWISKSIGQNRAPGFAEELVLDLPSDTEGTGLAVHDDRLFVITTNGAYVVLGEPLDDTGGGSIPVLQKISDRGCRHPRSIVSFDGVWYISDAQIIRIDRGLGVAEAGGAVDDLPIDTEDSADYYGIADGVYLNEHRELRWYFGCGQWVAYNVLHQAWSRNSVENDNRIPSVCEWRGDAFTMFSEEGWCYEDDGESADVDIGFAQRARLPWFAGGGRTGGMRVHDVQILGENPQTGTLSLRLYRNFDDSLVTYATKDLTAEETAMRIGHRPKVRKVQSLSLELETETDPDDEGIKISGIGVTYHPRSMRRSIGGARRMSGQSNVLALTLGNARAGNTTADVLISQGSGVAQEFWSSLDGWYVPWDDLPGSRCKLRIGGLYNNGANQPGTILTWRVRLGSEYNWNGITTYGEELWSYDAPVNVDTLSVTESEEFAKPEFPSWIHFTVNPDVRDGNFRDANIHGLVVQLLVW